MAGHHRRNEPQPVRDRLPARLRGLVTPRFVLAVPTRRWDSAGLAVACVLLAAAAVVALVLRPDVLHGLPPTPPRPAAAAGAPADPSASDSTPPGSPQHRAATFRCRPATGHGDASTPQRICIPGIRVDASVMQLGLNHDRTVQVPPLSQVGDAGWYKYSAAPGAVGPTVILGHVDSAQYGDGVFYRLSRLHSGDTVSVARADGRTAVYAINSVKQISKKAFPTDSVYGPTSGPALRLVTCGGRFDASRGSYEDNIIAYGTLRSLRAP